MEFKVGKWLYYIFWILASFCLLLPAYYNGFPLVNPDTGTYISSGFLPEMPPDRPIVYGLLLRLMALNGLSLWLVVFAQAAIVSWLIFRIVWNVSGPRFYIFKSMLAIIILSVCTSLSWLVSQVQPDVYTSVAFLALALLLMGKENNITNTFLYILFFLAVSTHLSHPVLFILSLGCISVLAALFPEIFNIARRKMVLLFTLTITSMLLMITPLHKSRHIFMAGSLLEKGVLKPYLDDNCSHKNYKICAYKDVLPNDANTFWWDINSPLNKMGDWKSSKSDFDNIIQDIFLDPKYAKMYFNATVKQTGKQFVTFNIGDGNQKLLDGTYVFENLFSFFSKEVDAYRNALQNTENIFEKLQPVNRFFSWIIFFSAVICVYILSRWKMLSKEVRVIMFMCLSGVFLNCVDCAAFGILNGRYGCKMIWFIPFIVIVYGCATLNIKRN